MSKTPVTSTHAPISADHAATLLADARPADPTITDEWYSEDMLIHALEGRTDTPAGDARLLSAARDLARTVILLHQRLDGPSTTVTTTESETTAHD